MKAMIVRFDFSGCGDEALADWRRYVVEESVPRFEGHAGLRHKLFLFEEDPPAAVAVYLFADDEAFGRYAQPLLEGRTEFTTTRRFGAPGEIRVLNVAGVADGPEAPGSRMLAEEHTGSHRPAWADHRSDA
jgi:hypothetical protein